MPEFCAGVKGLGLAAAGGFAGGAGVFAGMPAACWGRLEAFTLIIWGRRPRAGLGMGSSRDGTCSTPLQLCMNAAKQRSHQNITWQIACTSHGILHGTSEDVACVVPTSVMRYHEVISRRWSCDGKSQLYIDMTAVADACQREHLHC